MSESIECDVLFISARTPSSLDLTLKELQRRSADPAWAKIVAGSTFHSPLSILDHFRLGPLLEHVPLARFFLVERATRDVVASSIMGHLWWDGHAGSLPEGWGDAVRRLYLDFVTARRPNTGILLSAAVDHKHRGGTLVERLLAGIQDSARDQRLEHLIAPALPTSRTRHKELAEMPFSEFVRRVRPDGMPEDPWIRRHIKLGARILKHSESSHRFVWDLRALPELGIDVAELPTVGHCVAKATLTPPFFSEPGWIPLFVDKQKNIAVAELGCVWIEHPVLDPPPIPTGLPARPGGHVPIGPKDARG